MTSIEDATRAWAKGIYPIEAGVELLIRHGKAIYENAPWLIDLRDDRALEVVGVQHHAEERTHVAIDVDRLLEHAGAWSGSERRIARIAASLIDGTPVDLNDALPGLDRTTLTDVLAAIAHANGSHEHSGVLYNEAGSPAGFEQLPSLYPWSRPLPDEAAQLSDITITNPDALRTRLAPHLAASPSAEAPTPDGDRPIGK